MMKDHTEPWLSAWLALAALALISPAVAETPQPSDEGYEAGTYGRLRYEENGVRIVRSETGLSREFPEAGEVNAPILPGDTLLSDRDQRAEIQLAGGSLVRVDGDSEITFLSLPDPYAELADNTVLQVSRGLVRIDAVVGGEEEFRVDTPDATIYALGDADLRIEVRGDGTTRVASRRGVAEVVNAEGSVILRGGMGTEIRSGREPEAPLAFNTFLGDDFDRWVRDREATHALIDEVAAASPEAYDALPVEVRPYHRELSRHGSWVVVAEIGYVWKPRVPVGWAPYRHGYWNHGPAGYFWVSTEPWGWAPYHYGRWSWVSGHGWAWLPGRVFGGAWVSWSFGPSYVGWCALDYWNRPVLRARPHHGYYDHHTWVFVDYTHFGSRHSWRHHVRADRVRDLPTSIVVTRPPRVAPADLARRDVRERAIDRLRTAPTVHVPPPQSAAATRRTHFSETEREFRSARARSAAVNPVAPSAAAERPTGARETGRSAGRDERAAGDSGATSDRMRDVYRRASRPRETRSPDATPRATTPGPSERDRGGERDATAERGRSGTDAPSRRPSSADTRRQTSRTAPPRASVDHPSQANEPRTIDRRSPGRGSVRAAPTTRSTVAHSPSRSNVSRAPSRPTVSRSPSRSSASRAPSQPTVSRSPSRSSASRAPSRPTVSRSPSRSSASRAPARPTVSRSPASSARPRGGESSGKSAPAPAKRSSSASRRGGRR